MKVKLLFETDRGKEVLVGLAALPCVGEVIVLDSGAKAEVLQVVNTPTNPGCEAIVVLRNREE